MLNIIYTFLQILGWVLALFTLIALFTSYVGLTVILAFSTFITIFTRIGILFYKSYLIETND